MFLLGIGVFSLCFGTFALDASKSIYQYNCLTWSRQNGLPANSIRAISQTSDGYLWLGTQKGLVRFDGMNFLLVPVPNHPMWRSQTVGALTPRARGGLWFGIDKGAFEITAQKGELRAVS